MNERPILLFDFGGTLDCDGIAWKERFHDLCCGPVLPLTAEEFAPLFYAADDPLVGGLPEGADLAVTVRQLGSNLEAAFAAQGLTCEPAAADRFLEESLATLARNRPILRALRDRYRLGIVSNFYGNLDHVCRGVGLDELFEVIVDSEQVGVSKPEAAIFQAALQPLGGEAADAIMVGDSLRRDREGARRLGMGFVWIAPPQVRAAETDPLDHPVIGELGELLSLLP